MRTPGTAKEVELVSQFIVVTRVRCAPERLFDLSLSIDLHKASMARSRERAIAGVTSGIIGLGETVTWRARHFGLWFTMTSRISELDRPYRFVDEQIAGPFRMFHHEHRFRAVGDETEMTDAVTLASPIFGAAAERTVLVPYLRRLIVERNRHLVEIVRTRSPA